MNKYSDTVYSLLIDDDAQAAIHEREFNHLYFSSHAKSSGWGRSNTIENLAMKIGWMRKEPRVDKGHKIIAEVVPFLFSEEMVSTAGTETNEVFNTIVNRQLEDDEESHKKLGALLRSIWGN